LSASSPLNLTAIEVMVARLGFLLQNAGAVDLALMKSARFR
jgi:hypothetical protein